MFAGEEVDHKPVSVIGSFTDINTNKRPCCVTSPLFICAYFLRYKYFPRQFSFKYFRVIFSFMFKG
jgi:hypothetical protein